MIVKWFKHFDGWLWQPEPRKAPLHVRQGWLASRVAFAVGRDLADGRITLFAMSLVYTTLLSIVPFLALSFSVLKGFGVHNQLEPALEQMLVAPLGPDKGRVVVENVLTFVDNIKVGVLGSVGLGLLIYTVISLVQKIEYSFNEIWHIARIRSIGQRFSNYLSVILIGPLLIFSALGATAAIVNTQFVQQLAELQALDWLFGLVARVVPYLMIIALFTFLYVMIPNTKVRFRYALVGGTVAGLVWQTAGFAFTLFAAGSTKYDAIYSGFAVGIMLLIWIYLAWLILLLGAAVAYYAQHARQISRARLGAPSAELDELTGLQIAYRAAKKFDESGGPCSVSALEGDPAISASMVQRTINKLTRHKLFTLAGHEQNQILPGRSLDRIKLRELVRALRLPDETAPVPLEGYDAITGVVRRIDDAYDRALGDVTLAEWVRGESTGTGKDVRSEQPAMRD